MYIYINVLVSVILIIVLIIIIPTKNSQYVLNFAQKSVLALENLEPLQ